VRILVRPAAAADIAEAFEWYESRRVGLGVEFVRSMDAALESLRRAPSANPIVHRDVRRALLRRFPYGVFYRVIRDEILVVACFHGSRDPRRWQGRR